MLNVVSTGDQNPLAHALDGRCVALDAFDDQRARHAIEHLLMTLAVRVRVIPEQAGEMIGRDRQRVVERLPGHRHHVEHVVLRTVGRDRQPVKVQVRHVHLAVGRG